MIRSVGLLLATLVALLASGGLAAAQDGIDVRESAARSDFPDGIVFTLDAASDGGFDEVRLVYQVAPDGVRASAIPDCVGGAVVSCTFVLEATRENVLVPGAEVTYSWRLTVGEVSEDTASQTVTYEDDRFTWRQISEGDVTIYWYVGSEEEARRVLAAGRESLDAMSSLLQTTIDFPVKIRYYASAEDMRPAIIADEAGGVITLGEVIYSDTAMVSADSSPEEIARHEVAHLVVGQALKGPYDVPAWLNEGTAVFAQGQPLAGQRAALERAIESGQVLSVASLSSASSGAQGSRVELFYGQAYSLVAFLVDSYGQDKFAELFRTFKEGATTDEALEQVYGFDQDGLENAWRESVGLPPREPPTPEEEEEATPANTPTTEEQEAPPSDAGGGAPIGVMVGIGVVTALLAGGLVGAGVVLARRSR